MSSAEVISDTAAYSNPENLEILVVDDDEDIRWLFTYILSKAGFSVNSACDYKGAIEQIEKKKFDIIVLDYILPEIKGSQLAIEILEKRSDVKIIFITGYPDFSDDLMNDPQLLSQTVLYKPITGDSLLKTIKSLQ